MKIKGNVAVCLIQSRLNGTPLLNTVVWLWNEEAVISLRTATSDHVVKITSSQYCVPTMEKAVNQVLSAELGRLVFQNVSYG